MATPQLGSIAAVHGGEREREIFPIHQINRYLGSRARPGDLAVIHSSYYLFFFRHYYQQPHPAFIGPVQEGFQLRPFGGLHDQADEAAVQRLLQRLAGRQRVWLVLTPTTNAHLRDPRGLIAGAMSQRYSTLEQRCFACNSGDPVQVKLLAPKQ